VLHGEPKPETLLHRLGRPYPVNRERRLSLVSLPKPRWIREEDAHPGVEKGAPLAKRFILYEAFATKTAARSAAGRMPPAG